MFRFNSPPRSSDEEHKLPQRRRRSKRRSNNIDSLSEPVYIKVGNPNIGKRYQEVVAHGPRDKVAFQHAVERTLQENPDFPLIIIVSGWSDWLDEVLVTCIVPKEEVRARCKNELRELNLEVQIRDTFRFPERSIVEEKTDQRTVTWSFVIDHINLPEVYRWSVEQDSSSDLESEKEDQRQFENKLRFRLGAWTCTEGAYERQKRKAHDRRYHTEAVNPVAIIFADPELPSTWRSDQLQQVLFKRIYSKGLDWLERLYERNNAICWVFFMLWDIMTNWDNVLLRFETRLEAAENNSADRNGLASVRTRECHQQIRQIYTLQQYLRFHLHSFNVLNNIQNTQIEASENASVVSAPGDLWSSRILQDEIDQASADLDQYYQEFDLLIDRLKNLTEFEFNIESMREAVDTRFLTVIATIFLPLSFLASIWGMTEFSGSPLLFLYIAIPIVIFSALFAYASPRLTRTIRERRNERKHPDIYLSKMGVERKRVLLLDNQPPEAIDRAAIQEKHMSRRRKVDP